MLRVGALRLLLTALALVLLPGAVAAWPLAPPRLKGSAPLAPIAKTGFAPPSAAFNVFTPFAGRCAGASGGLHPERPRP